MIKAKIYFYLSILPFWFGVVLILFAKSNIYGYLFLIYSIIWLLFWGFIVYKKNSNLRKKDIFIGIAVIVGGISIIGLTVGLILFGVK